MKSIFRVCTVFLSSARDALRKRMRPSLEGGPCRRNPSMDHAVAQEDDARAEHPRLEQLEVAAALMMREVGRAAADEHRVDPHPEFVDESRIDRLPREVGAADGDVPVP